MENLEEQADKILKGNVLEEKFLEYFTELENCRLICEDVKKKYGEIVKIRRIFARPKGSKYEYYQITYEKG